jgi:hypothetical protein
MAPSGKKSKTVHNEAMGVISRINSLYKLESVEKSIILPQCPTTKDCGVRVTVKFICTEIKERNDGSRLNIRGKKRTRKPESLTILICAWSKEPAWTSAVTT